MAFVVQYSPSCILYNHLYAITFHHGLHQQCPGRWSISLSLYSLWMSRYKPSSISILPDLHYMGNLDFEDSYLLDWRNFCRLDDEVLKSSIAERSCQLVTQSMAILALTETDSIIVEC